MQVQNIQSSIFRGDQITKTSTNHLEGKIDSCIKITQDSENNSISKMAVNFSKNGKPVGCFGILTTKKGGIPENLVDLFFTKIINTKYKGIEWVVAYAKTLIRK